MNKSIVISLVIILSGCFGNWECDAQDTPETNLFRMTVIPPKVPVHVKEKFDLLVKVKNISGENAKWVGCERGSNWMTDNTRISWDLSQRVGQRGPAGLRTDEHFPGLVIASGDSLTNTLSVCVAEPVPDGKVSFRLGCDLFTGYKAEAPPLKPPQVPTILPEFKRIWSDEVMLEVIP